MIARIDTPEEGALDEEAILNLILEIADETIPDYDFAQLWKENQENLIGKYIEAFSGCEAGSVEYEALCEGVQALMANRQ